MGQRHGTELEECASPVFAVDKVRGSRGAMALTSRYHTGRRLQADYKVERCVLGSGASGPVHRARRGVRQFAVKSFKKRTMQPEEKIELRREVEVYLKLDHPHVARLEDVYETGKELHLVMELCSGGELYDRLTELIKKRRSYNEIDAARTTRQMLLAVAYLHAHNIIHRDLKLENFLYERADSDHLKLIDFGFAKYHNLGEKMSRSCGSLHYIAPEVLAKNYDEKADLWSLGVIVYMLVTGQPPFFGSTDSKCLNRIQKGEPCYSQAWKMISPGAQNFVLKLLTVDPKLRPSAAEALKEPWLCTLEMKEPTVKLDIQVLTSLRKFSRASHFRRACLSMMAWSLTREDQMELRRQFEAMDLNKSGTITQQELASCLQANFSIDTSEAESLFRGLDADGTDEIGYSEFLAAAMEDRMRMHQDVLNATFDRFDEDGTGQITVSNLRALVGDTFEGSDVEELIREADQTGDGRISRPEFLKYINNHEESEEEEEPPVEESPTEASWKNAPATPRSPTRARLTKQIHGHMDAAITAKAAVEKTPEMSPRLAKKLTAGSRMRPSSLAGSFLPDENGNMMLPEEDLTSSTATYGQRKRWRFLKCFERVSDAGES